MDKFIKEYHGRVVEDNGAYMSEEAKSFFRKMKNYINRCAPEHTITKWRVGHYHVSCFLVKPHEEPIYVSYSIPRSFPIDVYRADPMFGVLYRRAKDTNDYRGGTNHFCSLADLSDSNHKWLLI